MFKLFYNIYQLFQDHLPETKWTRAKQDGAFVFFPSPSSCWVKALLALVNTEDTGADVPALASNFQRYCHRSLFPILVPEYDKEVRMRDRSSPVYSRSR